MIGTIIEIVNKDNKWGNIAHLILNYKNKTFRKALKRMNARYDTYMQERYFQIYLVL